MGSDDGLRPKLLSHLSRLIFFNKHIIIMRLRIFFILFLKNEIFAEVACHLVSTNSGARHPPRHFLQECAVTGVGY